MRYGELAKNKRFLAVREVMTMILHYDILVFSQDTYKTHYKVTQAVRFLTFILEAFCWNPGWAYRVL
jgi:hypothetical protein